MREPLFAAFTNKETHLNSHFMVFKSRKDLLTLPLYHLLNNHQIIQFKFSMNEIFQHLKAVFF